MESTNRIKKLLQPILTLLLILLLLGLRFPSFIEPIYYLDEGIYAAIANILQHGGILYKDAFDNKPPSIYYLFSLSRFLWGYGLLPLKIFIALCTGFSTFALFHLTMRWFPSNWFTPYLVSFLFVFMTAFEGNVVNAEIIFIGSTLGALLLMQNFEREERMHHFFLAGLLFGIGISFKSTAAFDAIAFILFYSFCSILPFNTKNNLRTYFPFLKRLACLIAAMIIPMVIYALYFFRIGAGSDFFYGVFFSNKEYVSYFNNKVGPITTLSINAAVGLFGLLLVFGSYFFYEKQKRPISKYFLYILIWLILGTYAAFISGRPYPHYLLQIAPPLALLIAVTIMQARIITLSLEFFAVGIMLLYFNRNAQISLYKSLIKDQITYYETSYAFFSGKISRDEYYDIFKLNSDGLTASDLKDLIDTTNKYNHSSKELFYVWGSIPWIAAASNFTPTCKYIDNFDINTFLPQQNYMIRCLEEKKPLLIVHEDSSYVFPALLNLENTKYHLVESLYGNQIRFYLRNNF